MSQADFAAFLEDRVVDVTDPSSALDTVRKVMEALLCTFASPSRLLDLARGLTVRINSVVVSAQNLKSGESVLRFVHDEDQRRASEMAAHLARSAFRVKPEDMRDYTARVKRLGKDIPKGIIEIWVAR